MHSKIQHANTVTYTQKCILALSHSTSNLIHIYKHTHTQPLGSNSTQVEDLSQPTWRVPQGNTHSKSQQDWACGYTTWRQQLIWFNSSSFKSSETLTCISAGNTKTSSTLQKIWLQTAWEEASWITNVPYNAFPLFINTAVQTLRDSKYTHMLQWSRVLLKGSCWSKGKDVPGFLQGSITLSVCLLWYDPSHKSCLYWICL